METTKPRPSPGGLVSPDDCGLWMKMDADPVTERTGSPMVNRDETSAPRPGPAGISRYRSVMDDEGVDHDFIPPPPPHTAPLLPAEGSTDARVNHSSVTLTKGAAEAKDNPSGLDWHPGERHLMTTRNELDEVIVSTEQTSTPSMDTASLSTDSVLPRDQDQTSMEDACSHPTGRRHQENSTGDEESDGEPEDVGILSEAQETEAGKDNYPKQVSSSNSDNEMHFDKEGACEDIRGPDETDSKLTAEHADCGDVQTNAPAGSSLRESDDGFKSDQHTMDRATGQPQVQEVPAGESNGDEEHVDTRSLNYTLTKCNWVRRESGNSETLVSRLSVSDGDEEMATKDEQGDGGRRISTGIQQGEQLLQRLQLVQLRQDVSGPEQASQQGVQETRGQRLGTGEDDLKARGAHLTGADEEEESVVHGVESEGARSNLMAVEKNERKDVEAKARRSSSQERHKTAGAEAGDSDDDHSDGRAPADPNETSSTHTPFPSSCHPLPVSEPCIEGPVVQEAQRKQRAGGVVDLADNPDVLEIPFKNNISLEPFPTQDGPEQLSGWQFSERRMKKEISRETQRELVLFNQGRIPGEYSKGEVRQLKETRLLFEAFQQEGMEGPTRKPPVKRSVYPSVLERTRSLEMLSLKMCPVSRAHSFRLDKETETHAEVSRPTSPAADSRDETHSSPCAKPDKPAHLCRGMDSISRSMDSISTDASTAAVGSRGGAREGTGAQDSPILRGNPFFKLRPALGLKPEVEKDIREAKEREEELRRQRCTLYGENRRSGEDGERSRVKATLVPDRKPSRGKLERVWPPPSKKDQMRAEQTQQEPKVPKAGGQRAPLWQRWESGLINGKTPKEKK